VVDFAKKIEKGCGDDLEAGEKILATLFVQAVGSVRRQVGTGFGAGLGGGVAARGAGLVAGRAAGEVAARRKASEVADEHGEDALTGRCVLCLTDSRFLVFDYNTGLVSGKVTGLVVALAHEQVSLELEMGKLTGKLAVTVEDGANMAFDIVKTAKPGDFIETFNSVVGR